MVRTIRQTLYLFYTLLLINSCQCGKRTYNGNEVVLFVGEIGAGKSTLCNSVFQQVVFKSGVNMIPLGGNMGITTHKQHYVYKDALYIDTPGVDFLDLAKHGPANKEERAKEIEKALKYNNNYKLIFVVRHHTPNSSETAKVIKMIDTICNAIQTNFEYGIIFNQVPESFIQAMHKHGIDQEKVHESAYFPVKPLKAPFLSVVLKEDATLKDASNKYFQANDENRKKLLDFINKLKAYKIAPSEVSKINGSKLN